MKKGWNAAPVVLLALSGCSLWPFDVGVDNELKPFVDSFFMEAEARGLSDIRPGALNVQFKDLGKTNGRTVKLTNTIYINPDSYGWKTNPEALVYHELGHLILKRKHKNDFKKGSCVSIMADIYDPIYSIFPEEKLYYRREYYINELFDPSTKTPEWMN